MQAYVSKEPDTNGYRYYTPDEDRVWAHLYRRQQNLLHDRACEEFIAYLDLLDINKKKVPQLHELNLELLRYSGWTLEAVDGMTSFDDFFSMLSHKMFPAATFIRRREHLDFIDKPDIFHEVFGHAPLLVHRSYAQFSQIIGSVGVGKSHEFQKLLAAVYWYTCETGAVQNYDGTLRLYGASAISSPEEICYAATLDKTRFVEFSIAHMIRNKYRINELTKTYYVIPNLAFLSEVTASHIEEEINKYLEECEENRANESLEEV